MTEPCIIIDERCHLLKQFLTDEIVEPDDKLESMCRTCFDKGCISCVMNWTEAQKQMLESLEIEDLDDELDENNTDQMLEDQNPQQKATSLTMGDSFFYFQPTRLKKNSLLRTQLT